MISVMPFDVTQVAKYAAQLEKFERAIEIYEQVASSCIDSSLLKYSAKEYFFRATLCHLAIDVLNATHALNKYDEMYPSFADSREYKFSKVKYLLSTDSFRKGKALWRFP